MIVFEMRSKVFGQIGDPLCQNRYLNLRRTGVARLPRIVLDERLFALGCDRHRMTSLRDKPSKPKARASNSTGEIAISPPCPCEFCRPRGPARMSSSRVEQMAHSRAWCMLIHETDPE